MVSQANAQHLVVSTRYVCKTQARAGQILQQLLKYW